MRGHPDIFSAIMSDDLEAVEMMLASDASLAARHDGRSPVLLAAYRHRADVLQALLSRQPALDIFEAAAAGDFASVRDRIIEAPEAVERYSEDGFTPLHLAAFFGHRDVAEFLLDHGASVDATTRNDLQNTPLHAAAAGRHCDLCALLLDHGAPVNARQEGGSTALHAAAQHGDMPLAKLLIADGADPSIETDAGKTAAELAYEFEHDEVAGYLRSLPN